MPKFALEELFKTPPRSRAAEGAGDANQPPGDGALKALSPLGRRAAGSPAAGDGGRRTPEKRGRAAASALPAVTTTRGSPSKQTPGKRAKRLFDPLSRGASGSAASPLRASSSPSKPCPDLSSPAAGGLPPAQSPDEKQHRTPSRRAAGSPMLPSPFAKTGAGRDCKDALLRTPNGNANSNTTTTTTNNNNKGDPAENAAGGVGKLSEKGYREMALSWEAWCRGSPESAGMAAAKDLLAYLRLAGHRKGARLLAEKVESGEKPAKVSWAEAVALAADVTHAEAQKLAARLGYPSGCLPTHSDEDWARGLTEELLRDVLQMYCLASDAQGDASDDSVSREQLDDLPLAAPDQRVSAVLLVSSGRPSVRIEGFQRFFQQHTRSLPATRLPPVRTKFTTAAHGADRADDPFLKELFDSLDSDKDGLLQARDLLPIVASSHSPLRTSISDHEGAALIYENRWLHFSNQWVYDKTRLPPHLAPSLQ
ncbi:hypothetical protein DIPPA_34708 [Diplonema papillatum]|nr:hypothetical protein DIPPA_34708 [Diplonema papillatum]